MTELQCQKLDPRAVLPSRAHPGDAGLDLCCLDRVEIGPGERVRVPTGIAIELPAGHAGLIVPRSGLAAKQGISIVNAPGLIDEGYRGELQVLLLNTDLALAVTLEAGRGSHSWSCFRWHCSRLWRSSLSAKAHAAGRVSAQAAAEPFRPR